jgi:DNA-binding transcriptional MerR regulator
MNRQIMTIRQLADRAGVTQRTIRYYTDEGLIDAPVDKVRMPRYTERHLLQLQAAAHLKAGYLPLRVIRARLAGLAMRSFVRLSRCPSLSLPLWPILACRKLKQRTRLSA